jgi:urease accessory protein
VGGAAGRPGTLDAASGKLGLQIPLAESMIAGSVLLLGALIAFAVRLPVAVCAVLAGFFAIFHGYAHGVEGAGYSGGLYLSGVLLATLVLHAVGIAAAAGMRRIETIPALRLAGGCVAAVGLALIAA